jgi:hypothetical protein
VPFTSDVERRIGALASDLTTSSAPARLCGALSPSRDLVGSLLTPLVAGNLTYNSRVGTLDYPSPGAPRPHAPAFVAGAPMLCVLPASVRDAA